MTCGWVLGLDPALNSPGVAIGHGGVVLAAAALSQPRSQAALAVGERALLVAVSCAAWFRQGVAKQLGKGAELPELTLVFELPQVYGGPRAEDPNDLIALALVCGAATAALERELGVAAILSPTPREWSKGSKKSKKAGEGWTSQRGAMIARRLSPAERALVPDSHDAIDAVGLVLFAQGRLEPIRVNARPRAGA